VTNSSINEATFASIGALLSPNTAGRNVRELPIGQVLADELIRGHVDIEGCRAVHPERNVGGRRRRGRCRHMHCEERQVKSRGRSGGGRDDRRSNARARRKQDTVLLMTAFRPMLPPLYSRCTPATSPAFAASDRPFLWSQKYFWMFAELVG
jgi:hypothetical protein